MFQEKEMKKMKEKKFHTRDRLIEFEIEIYCKIII